MLREFFGLLSRFGSRQTPRMGVEELWEHAEELDFIYDELEGCRDEVVRLTCEADDCGELPEGYPYWCVEQRARMFALSVPSFLVAMEAEIRALLAQCAALRSGGETLDQAALRQEIAIIADITCCGSHLDASAQNEYLRRSEVCALLQGLYSELYQAQL